MYSYIDGNYLKIKMDLNLKLTILNNKILEKIECLDMTIVVHPKYVCLMSAIFNFMLESILSTNTKGSDQLINLFDCELRNWAISIVVLLLFGYNCPSTLTYKL